MPNDPIRDAVLNKVYDKYEAGVKEHGNKGLAEANFTTRQYLENLQEELIDSLMYIEGLLQK